MRITASVRNTVSDHRVSVSTADVSQDLSISAKATGRGSGVNGGEFLMLALATCFCNDIYREAARLSIPVDSVEVEARADFGAVGIAAKNISYRARVESSAPLADIEELLRQTDAVAEVQNTIRAGVEVLRLPWTKA
jgi:organic hydroperoxide reductase OsmC/OhrA